MDWGESTANFTEKLYNLYQFTMFFENLLFTEYLVLDRGGSRRPLQQELPRKWVRIPPPTAVTRIPPVRLGLTVDIFQDEFHLGNHSTIVRKYGGT